MANMLPEIRTIYCELTLLVLIGANFNLTRWQALTEHGNALRARQFLAKSAVYRNKGAKRANF